MADIEFRRRTLPESCRYLAGVLNDNADKPHIVRSCAIALDFMADHPPPCTGDSPSDSDADYPGREVGLSD